MALPRGGLLGQREIERETADKNLMCPIQYRFLLVCCDSPNGHTVAPVMFFALAFFAQFFCLM